MKHLFILFLSGLFAFPLIADAQVTPQKKREILYSVVTVMEDYEQTNICDTDASEYNFQNLFISDDVKIYNDLLGFSGKEYLPLNDYTFIMKTKVMNPTIKLKNIRYKNIIERADLYEVVLLFDKELSYSNKSGVLFSSQDYYGEDYQLDMVVYVDKNTMEGKIATIKGNLSSTKAALVENEYYVLNKDSLQNEDVKCNGKPIEFNSFDQAFLPAVYEFTHPDPDMEVKLIKPDDESPMVSLKYKLRKWSLAPYFEMSMLDNGKMNDDFGKINYESSSMTEFGIVAKYVFPRKKKTKWAFNLGVGYSISKIDLTADNIEYSYKTTSPLADIDGEHYYRYYNVSDVRQSLQLNHLVIPAFFNLESKWGRRFTFIMQFGAKVYWNLKAETTDFFAKQYVYGKYENYGPPIIIDSPEYWGYNNFGHGYLGMNNLETNVLNAKPITVDAFGGLGFRVNIFGPVSLFATARYQYGFLDILTPNGECVEIVQNKVLEKNAFVNYLTVEKGEKTRGLANTSTTFHRQALFLNVGVDFKF